VYDDAGEEESCGLVGRMGQREGETWRHGDMERGGGVKRQSDLRHYFPGFTVALSVSGSK